MRRSEINISYLTNLSDLCNLVLAILVILWYVQVSLIINKAIKLIAKHSRFVDAESKN